MLLSRRVISFTIPWAISFFSVDTGTSTRTRTETNQADDTLLVDWICRFTPSEFRAAIRDSGNFLYRGDDNHASTGILQQPIPDLLMPETYGNDPAALAYFQCLEERLHDETRTCCSTLSAKPSTGHIATSDPEEAAKWGSVVSVWPVGTEWSYVWPCDRETFYDSRSALCRDDALAVDTGLDQALQQRREILFATSGLKNSDFTMSKSSDVAPSSFLAISKTRDSVIREKLVLLNYGLT